MQTTEHELGGVSRKIANDLRQMISQRQWQVGERLPAVRLLAQQFGVSTETIRGAMRELEALDLIDTKPRQGGFVKAYAPPKPTASHTSKALVAFVRTATDSTLDPSRIDSDDEWGMRVTFGTNQRLDEADFMLTLVTAPPDTTELTRVLLEKLDRLGASLAGVVFLFRETLRPLYDIMRKRNIPCVIIGAESSGFQDNFVAAANISGGRMVGQCFAKLGYGRLLYLSTDLRQRHSALDKFTGLMQGYLLDGQTPPQIDHLTTPDWSHDAGQEAVKRYLSEHQPPEGIFAEGDLLALGSISACRQAGLSVPGDVSVVGSTDMARSRFVDPPLTTVQQPAAQLGLKAGEMILKLLSGGHERLPGELVPTALILRQSIQLSESLRQTLMTDQMCPIQVQ